MNVNALGGIITGLVAAWATDKFYKLELPIAFAFFSGKKISSYNNNGNNGCNRFNNTIYMGNICSFIN